MQLPSPSASKCVTLGVFSPREVDHPPKGVVWMLLQTLNLSPELRFWGSPSPAVGEVATASSSSTSCVHISFSFAGNACGGYFIHREIYYCYYVCAELNSSRIIIVCSTINQNSTEGGEICIDRVLGEER